MKQVYRIYLLQLSIILTCLLPLLICVSSLGFATEQQTQADLLLIPEADTYVFSGTSTAIPPPNWRVLWVGHNDSPTIQTERALVKFNLTNLPVSATIQSAVFSLYLRRAEPTTDPEMIINVYRLREDWPEMIIWRDYVKLTQINQPSTSREISSTVGGQAWDVKALVEHWQKDSDRGAYLSLVVLSNNESGNHERVFWSKDCPVNECGNNQPTLKIQYTLPPPPTPTRTPTFTPTPGVAYLNLRSDPTGVITRGQTVTYFIDYGVVGYPNQDYQLTNVVITNVVPSALELVPKSLPTPSAKLVVTQTRANGATLLTWTFGEPLSDGAQGTLAYQAQRPTLTPTLVPTAPPTPGSLQIAKVGPAVATPNDFLLYTLVVTNTSNTLATNVIITDRIPANARYITGGELKDGVARFVIGDLAIGGQASHTLVVAATQTITNSDYGVRSDEGVVVMGTTPVVTYIGVNVTPPTPDGDSITHQGATIRWFYRDEKKEPLTSLPIFNPSFKAYLPVAARQD